MRLTDDAVQDALGARRAFGVAAAKQLGGDRAGRDGVDGDAVAAQLHGQGARQAHQPRLGGRVGDPLGLAQRRARGHVDDAPVPAGAQRGQAGLRQQQAGLQRERVDVGQVGGGLRVDGAGAGGAGVVDERGDRVAGEHALGDRPRGRLIAQVGLEGHEPGVLPVRQPIVDVGDLAALCQQRLADGTSDPGAAAGDEGDFLLGHGKETPTRPRGRFFQMPWTPAFAEVVKEALSSPRRQGARASVRLQTRSRITAMPCPTPMHIVHSA